jgi:hypothetical protein
VEHSGRVLVARESLRSWFERGAWVGRTGRWAAGRDAMVSDFHGGERRALVRRTWYVLLRRVTRNVCQH